MSNIISYAQKKLKGLTKVSSGGRNITGRITAFHRGGRGRRSYRYIDFWRRVRVKGVLLKNEYDPNRSGHIGLVYYYNGLMSYILLTEGLKIGSIISSYVGMNNTLDNNKKDGKQVKKLLVGNAFPLQDIPLGTVVSSVELYPNLGAQVARSAGAAALLYRKTSTRAYVKLASGWNLVIPGNAYAVVGRVSNRLHYTLSYGKAGVMRNLGFRPVVRGVAMNPIDHPHGGGQGRTSGGPQPLSPWGKITKWRPTVSTSSRRRRAHLRFR